MADGLSGLASAAALIPVVEHLLQKNAVPENLLLDDGVVTSDLEILSGYIVDNLQLFVGDDDEDEPMAQIGTTSLPLLLVAWAPRAVALAKQYTGLVGNTDFTAVEKAAKQVELKSIAEKQHARADQLADLLGPACEKSVDAIGHVATELLQSIHDLRTSIVQEAKGEKDIAVRAADSKLTASLELVADKTEVVLKAEMDITVQGIFDTLKTPTTKAFLNAYMAATTKYDEWQSARTTLGLEQDCDPKYRKHEVVFNTLTVCQVLKRALKAGETRQGLAASCLQTIKKASLMQELRSDFAEALEKAAAS